MNKQSQPTEESLTPDFLLRRYAKTEEIINEERKALRDQGIPEETINYYLNYISRSELVTKYKSSPSRYKQDKLFVDSITNPKSGRFWDIPTLLAAGKINEFEAEHLYPHKDYPYKETHRLSRVQTPDSREYLERFFTVYGITTEGKVVHRSFNNIDWFIFPAMEKGFRPVDIKNPESDQVSVAIVTMYPGQYEPAGTKIFINEFKPEKVLAAAKYAAGPPTDKYNGMCLAVYKSSDHNNTFSVDSVEEFLLPFEELWSKYRNPRSTASKVDVQDFLDELKKLSKQKGDKDTESNDVYG